MLYDAIVLLFGCNIIIQLFPKCALRLPWEPRLPHTCATRYVILIRTEEIILIPCNTSYLCEVRLSAVVAPCPSNWYSSCNGCRNRGMGRPRRSVGSCCHEVKLTHGNQCGKGSESNCAQFNFTN
ncbi:hypothetical protein AVEN_136633-1 [Araneus ventricosus]|uniref:Uncharacterized protein n=1 Tax=Araneus ventricosus TaxID=182803 RepID=A0A4Y2C9I3_ARAVE|nr:hypothetical protein AVEN_136633-1 [Araneus ventricosus]